MPSSVLLALLVVAAILAGIELLDSRAHSLTAWAVLLIAVVEIVGRL
jgi:hypothetical protein